MRGILVLLLCLALPGCLITSKPVFDETNSTLASESAAFVRIVEAWESMISKDSSPRELLTNGTRVIEKDGFVVIEDRSDSTPSHYAMSLLGPRVAICVVHHKGIEKIAARHGVAIQVDRDSLSDKSLPTVISADGKKALFAFVVDAFKDGLLVCQSGSHVVSGIN